MQASSSLHVAIIQAAPIFLNLKASTERAVQLLRAAARDGARLIVFPETWLPGYPVWLDDAPGSALWGHAPAERLFQRLFAHAPTLVGPEIISISKAATEAGADVILGLHERKGNSLYNSMLFLGSDGTRMVHRKLTPTFNERLIWAQGDGSTLGAWPRDYGTVGGLICWEHWMPLARAAMQAQ